MSMSPINIVALPTFLDKRDNPYKKKVHPAAHIYNYLRSIMGQLIKLNSALMHTHGLLKGEEFFHLWLSQSRGKKRPHEGTFKHIPTQNWFPFSPLFLLVVPYPRNTLELVCSQLHSINIEHMNNLKHLLQLLYEVLRILNDI